MHIADLWLPDGTLRACRHRPHAGEQVLIDGVQYRVVCVAVGPDVSRPIACLSQISDIGRDPDPEPIERKPPTADEAAHDICLDLDRAADAIRQLDTRYGLATVDDAMDAVTALQGLIRMGVEQYQQ